MDMQNIIYQAIVVVGITELVKKFIPLESSRLKALATVIVCAAVTVSVHFVPWILVPLMVLSVATVCYDTVFDLLKSLVNGLKKKTEDAQ